MKRFLKLFCVSLAFLMLVSMALAQGVATANLRGTVRDPKGAVVPGATVTVADEGKKIERSETTDNEGNYQLLQLPPGRYTVTVSAPNFAKLVSKDLLL